MSKPKLMKKNRQLHLWVGLLCSLLILIESVTGLLLSEPWLMGGNGGRPQMAVSGGTENAARSGTLPGAREQGGGAMTPQPAGERGAVRSGAEGRGQNSLMMWVRGLHEGRIGGTNLKIFVDIAAVGLIILTCSGIVLSIQTLRAGRIRRKRTLQEGDAVELSIQ